MMKNMRQEKVSNLYDSLPLATVVKVKNVAKPLMIAKKLTNSSFNYRCIPFPDGMYFSKLYIDIIKEDIELVYFMGCKNLN